MPSKLHDGKHKDCMVIHSQISLVQKKMVWVMKFCKLTGINLLCTYIIIFLGLTLPLIQSLKTFGVILVSASRALNA